MTAPRRSALLCALCVLLAGGAFGAGAHAPAPAPAPRAAPRGRAASAAAAAAAAAGASDAVAALRTAVSLHGCAVRLCFALDPSVRLGRDALGSFARAAARYRRQARFAATVASIAALDGRFRAGALDFGLPARPVAAITPNIPALVARLEKARFCPARATFAAAGVARCAAEFHRAGTPPKGVADKIVFLADARAYRFAPRFSVRVARRFRRRRGAICAVTAGGTRSRFWAHVTGDRRRVVAIDDFGRFFTVLNEVVRDLCALP